MNNSRFGRRDLLRAGTLLTVGSVLNSTAALGDACNSGVTVRDRLWLWGTYEGIFDGTYGIPKTTQITPVEAAYYMSVPNVVMVRIGGKPKLPFDQYAIPFRALHQVVWSAVGGGGATDAPEREAVLKLAKQNSNFIGVQMDDFFHRKENGKGEFYAALSLSDLEQLHENLQSGRRKLDLWVTLYVTQLDYPIGPYLKYIDVLTLWTWKPADIQNLATNLKKAESLSSRTRTVLGCYMWDFDANQPMTMSAMQQQCEQGLEWLHQGRIEGMIFLASGLCDLNLDTVEWARNWIQEVGAQPLFSHKKRI